ncbi:unnamed protein product, partial [Staurois parvus]
MDRLWEQRRLSNVPTNLEGLLGLQQTTLLELVTAVRAHTAVLQENTAVLHDIRALCQAGLDQNAPSTRGSQPLCSSCLEPMPRVPHSSPAESGGESAGEQALEVPILEPPTLVQPPQETTPQVQYASFPMPHTSAPFSHST